MGRQHGLTAWQLTMMAFGTVVGGLFFLGSAIAVKTAGPGIINLVLVVAVLSTMLASLYGLGRMAGHWRRRVMLRFG
jgi:AAT family amino acid transporter